MRSGGEIISLLYIIDNKKYKEYLEKDKYKYIFPVFTPTFHRKILDDIIIKEEVKGDIAGINLKEIDYREKSILQKVTENINKLKDNKHRYIFMEELKDGSSDIKNEIESLTGLYFPKEKDLKIYNIKVILEKLLESKNTLRDKEVLIVCKEQKLTSEIIQLLYKEFPFISILENVGWGDTICEDILNDIGLSIFREKDINKSIKRYGIIINMEKDTYINVDNIKKETIIFDYSNSYELRDSKNALLIEDITIDNKDKKNSLFPIELISSLHQNLNNSSRESFHEIYSRGKLYTLDELISSVNSLKGSI